MLKKLSDVAVGDWVLMDSILTSRAVGRPMQVTRVSKSRVYLQRFVVDPLTQVREVCDERHVKASSVRYVFSDEASAQAVFDYAEASFQALQDAVKTLRDQHDRQFQAYLASLPSLP